MLTSKQRSFLRALGNEMEPILTIGKGGISATVIEQLDQALSARELIKARVLPHTEYESRSIAEEMATAINCEIVQVIGRNILFYRQAQPGVSSKIPWDQM
ncbi:MAG TPA: YhbY family RNA-binding protein [Bacillota bacterium]